MQKANKSRRRKRFIFAATALCLCCGLGARFSHRLFQSIDSNKQCTWVFDEHCAPTFRSVVTQAFQASYESCPPTVAEFVKGLEFVQLSFPCITSWHLTTKPNAYHIRIHCKKPLCIINDKYAMHDGFEYPRSYFTNLDCPTFECDTTRDAQLGRAHRLTALPSALLDNYSLLSVDKHVLELKPKNLNENYALAVHDEDARASSKLALANFVGSYVTGQQESDEKWVVDTRFDKRFYARKAKNLKGGA